MSEQSISSTSANKVFKELTAFNKNKDHENVNVIIETPKGRRNKYKYDEEYGLFMLSGILPAGAVFPFDFGYVPSTLGEDGDPLDILVLLDEEVFVGCLIPSRLLGVIEAEQTERDGQTVRNDRLIAVAAASYNHQHVTSLEQLNQNLLNEIEHFFSSYNSARGKQFKAVGRAGVEQARQLIIEGVARYNHPH